MCGHRELIVYARITDSFRHLWVPGWYVLFGDILMMYSCNIFSVLGHCSCVFLGKVDQRGQYDDPRLLGGGL